MLRKRKGKKGNFLHRTLEHEATRHNKVKHICKTVVKQ